MPSKTKLLFALILCLAITAPVFSGPEQIKHIYVPEGVENVVILADRLNFQKEVDQFRSGRMEYGILWTGIVAGMIIYFNSRAR